MSLMLALLMALNAIAGVMVLPSFIVWSRARFVTRYEPAAASAAHQAQATSSGT
jgi:hypothetical protein